MFNTWNSTSRMIGKPTRPTWTALDRTVSASTGQIRPSQVAFLCLPWALFVAGAGHPEALNQGSVEILADSAVADLGTTPGSCQTLELARFQGTRC